MNTQDKSDRRGCLSRATSILFPPSVFVVVLLVSLMAFSTCEGAEFDEGPSGTLVTIRPEVGERATLVDLEGHDVLLHFEVPEMWLINPEAWRKAVATVTELKPYPSLLEATENALRATEVERDGALEEWSRTQRRFDEERGKNKQLRKLLPAYIGGGVAVGLGVGIGVWMAIDPPWKP